MSSDIGDVFKELRKRGKTKRAKNRENAPRLLKEAGITFDVYNSGAHLIVGHGDVVVDFWPGTGLWIPRTENTRGYGVHNLISYMEKNDGQI